MSLPQSPREDWMLQTLDPSYWHKSHRASIVQRGAEWEWRTYPKPSALVAGIEGHGHSSDIGQAMDAAVTWLDSNWQHVHYSLKELEEQLKEAKFTALQAESDFNKAREALGSAEISYKMARGVVENLERQIKARDEAKGGTI